MNPQITVLLAGFGHSVSKTHLSCAAQGLHVNTLARTVVQIEAAWQRILATRASVQETENVNDEKNRH